MQHIRNLPPEEVYASAQKLMRSMSMSNHVFNSGARRLEECTQMKSMSTTYNENPDVPPYTGIMFEVSAFSDVEILTFELDVRQEDASDMTVEIYTMEGSYGNRFSDRTAWKQLASTELILSKEGNSAVVPTADFTATTIMAKQRRSFYITMKGPYIDHTVYALQKEGELHAKGEDFQLLVGAGLTSYNFPNTTDHILSPQFAGVIHYSKSYECDDQQAATTVVSYPLLFQQQDGDFSLSETTRDAANKAMEDMLSTDPVLSAFVQDFGLQKLAPDTKAIKFAYECPEDWTVCPSSYLDTKVTFTHKGDLDSDTLSYELYRIANTIVDSITNAVGKQSVYLGYATTSTLFSITLNGVTEGQQMDAIQTKYFSTITEQFLEEATNDVSKVYYSVNVEEQSVSTAGRRSLSENGAIEIRGVVKGALISGTQHKQFRFGVDDAFRTKSSLYVTLLTLSGVLPGEINDEGRFDFFANIYSIERKITASDIEKGLVSDQPTEAAASVTPVTSETSGTSLGSIASGASEVIENAKGDKMAIGGFICGSIASFLFFLGIFALYVHQKKISQRNKDRDTYREIMRKRRRVERFEKEIDMRSDVQKELDPSLRLKSGEMAMSRTSTDSSTESYRSALPSVSPSRSIPANVVRGVRPAHSSPVRIKTMRTAQSEDFRLSSGSTPNGAKRLSLTNASSAIGSPSGPLNTSSTTQETRSKLMVSPVAATPTAPRRAMRHANSFCSPLRAPTNGGGKGLSPNNASSAIRLPAGPFNRSNDTQETRSKPVSPAVASTPATPGRVNRHASSFSSPMKAPTNSLVLTQQNKSIPKRDLTRNCQTLNGGKTMTSDYASSQNTNQTSSSTISKPGADRSSSMKSPTRSFDRNSTAQEASFMPPPSSATNTPNPAIYGNRHAQSMRSPGSAPNASARTNQAESSQDFRFAPALSTPSSGNSMARESAIRQRSNGTTHQPKFNQSAPQNISQSVSLTTSKSGSDESSSTRSSTRSFSKDRNTQEARTRPPPSHAPSAPHSSRHAQFMRSPVSAPAASAKGGDFKPPPGASTPNGGSKMTRDFATRERPMDRSSQPAPFAQSTPQPIGQAVLITKSHSGADGSSPTRSPTRSFSRDSHAQEVRARPSASPATTTPTSSRFGIRHVQSMRSPGSAPSASAKGWNFHISQGASTPTGGSKTARDFASRERPMDRSSQPAPFAQDIPQPIGQAVPIKLSHSGADGSSLPRSPTRSFSRDSDTQETRARRSPSSGTSTPNSSRCGIEHVKSMASPGSAPNASSKAGDFSILPEASTVNDGNKMTRDFVTRQRPMDETSQSSRFSPCIPQHRNQAVPTPKSHSGAEGSSLIRSPTRPFNEESNTQPTPDETYFCS